MAITKKLLRYNVCGPRPSSGYRAPTAAVEVYVRSKEGDTFNLGSLL